MSQIGTLPLDIRRYVTSLKDGETIESILDVSFTESTADLGGFKHKKIIEALKKSPDGVKTKMFDGDVDDGVLLSQPKEVAVAMKMQEAILYHLPSREYRFSSKAHRTAGLYYSVTQKPQVFEG